MSKEVIDLEEYAKAGKTPESGKKYRIKIDREYFILEVECMTGRELLRLAGKNPPEKFQLNQRLSGGKVEKIDLDEKVCFTKPGIEKFMTIPLDQTEGEDSRRQFDLIEEDFEFLESNGLPWEAIIENGSKWILIHNFPVVEGYKTQSVTVGIKIDPGYPRTQLDMAYFYPPLSRADDLPIGALSIQPLDGKEFQRWSRHRTPANPWRDEVDNLSTHLFLVKFWFEQEFEKRPYAISA